MNNPTQLLFALEAAYAFTGGTEGLGVTVVPTPSAADRDLYDNLFALAKPRQVHWLAPSALTRRRRLLDGAVLLPKISSVDFFFTSMLNYLPGRVLLAALGERAVVIDDGTWTKTVAEMRSANKPLRPSHRLLPFGQLPTSLSFFTIYDEITVGKQDEVIPNRLSWAKQLTPASDFGADGVLLGSDLVGSGYLRYSDYLATLSGIRGRIPGDVEYWPHRRESLNQAQQIAQELDLKIRARRLPLEAELMSLRPRPKTIGTLPSTSLRTLRLLSEHGEWRVVLGVPRAEKVAKDRMSAYRIMREVSIADADEVISL